MSAHTATDVQEQSFPGSRGKSKACAFSPTLREKEPQRRREELGFFLEILPTGLAWGLFITLVRFPLGGSTLQLHL